MKIEDVLQIKEQMLGDYSVQAVDGRSLWEALGVKTSFRNWMPRKLVEASAVLGKDYVEEVRPNLTGGDYHDYIITLPLAKDYSVAKNGEALLKGIRE